MSPRIAVLVPCYNEAVTIARVVADFQAALPGAQVYVYDNNSRDGTGDLARAAGAQVRHVGLQGKAQVMRRLFADVEADVYLMVDGDDTYHAASAPQLVRQVLEHGADMVVGVRVSTAELAYRPGHVLGNRLLTGFLSWLFGRPCKDILSGYRALSRRCVKSFPVLSTGFGIEAELTVHALELAMPISEVDTPYKERPEGSVSKLSTWRDGCRVLWTILRLYVAERPLPFYGLAALALAGLSLGLAAPVVATYLDTGLVPRFPTAILATGLALMAGLSLTAGLVLDTVTRGRREKKMLAYLATPGP
ncbi:glycosyltransferase family 2 protein [Arenimonas sp. MALMAid1274]|uniref:glycosyltransferase family 2 protein n=1 Tax=Arenimonas sp. MALMAid1274 TaxID=3411630 RepID=UPI003B9F755E